MGNLGKEERDIRKSERERESERERDRRKRKSERERARERQRERGKEESDRRDRESLINEIEEGHKTAQYTMAIQGIF